MTGRIELSTAEERVKSMFGMDLSPDGKTLVVYQSPVRMLPDEFQVQPTRLAFYDAETGALKSTAEAPARSRCWPGRGTAPGSMAWGARCMSLTPRAP